MVGCWWLWWCHHCHHRLLLLSSSVVVVVVVEFSRNESVMPKFWCESEKVKFLMIFNCGFLISSSV